MKHTLMAAAVAIILGYVLLSAVSAVVDKRVADRTAPYTEYDLTLCHEYEPEYPCLRVDYGSSGWIERGKR